MKAQSDLFKQELYDIIHEVMKDVVEDRKQENDLPYMISRSQLAKHIFNVSPQTLDTHIIHRPDFPKFKAGERILFPRDMVLDWIRKNVEVVERMKGDN